MPMERSRSARDRTKKSAALGSLLLPMKTPNKVGVAMMRSFSEHRRDYHRFDPDDRELLNLPKSPIMVSRRPLSLDVSVIAKSQNAKTNSKDNAEARTVTEENHKTTPVVPNNDCSKTDGALTISNCNTTIAVDAMQFLSPHDSTVQQQLNDFNPLRRCSSAEDTTGNVPIEFPVPLGNDRATGGAGRRLADRCMSHDTVIEVKASGTVRTGSSSLAKRALMAAQVLHLIPTSKARQRNFLQGRSGANSLLGKRELEKAFPNRELYIFVGSWNMNGHAPPKELNDFVLPISMENVPDILVFGTQESCSERFEWEVCLQETIGPSHILYHSVSLGTLHLTIFVRRDLIWYCSLPEEASISVRPGSAFKTKGAIASAFMLFGTSLLFVNTHLTAHQEKVKERVSDVKKILNALDLPKNLPIRNKNKDVTQNFDYVFWSGDLNFRLATPRTKVLEWLSHTSFPLPPHLPHGYLHHDQLCSVLADGAAFRGFTEANITFPPTYKYDPGTQNFDTSSKQRTPAYTDRILFKHRQTRRLSSQPETGPLQCLVYDSVPSITTSDHKPVWGVFKAFVRPGIDTMPLAAGLFNRDVYLEGIKRRAASLGDSKEANMACSVQ